MNRLYTLLTDIIGLLTETRKKMKKLDDYWNVSKALTVTYSTAATGYSITSASATVLNNHMIVDVEFKRTGAQVASGTTINVNLTTLTFSGLSGVLTSNSSVFTSNSTISAAGPIVTSSLISWSRTNNDKATMVLKLGATAGGVIAQNGAFHVRHVLTVNRDMTIS